MFEPIFDPQQNKTIVATLRQPTQNRDVEILKAYTRIAMDFKGMLAKNISRRKQQYVEWEWPWQIHKQTFVKEFVCQFCSLKLTLSDDGYIITLSVGIDAFQKGTGVNSNAILRVAFKQTSNEYASLDIENCLSIILSYNTLEYFDKKKDEYEEQVAVWFAKK